MPSGIDPKVDYAFKRVFGSEDTLPLLADLLNATVGFPPGKIVRDLTLQTPFIEKDYAEEKRSILDVRARDHVGRRFNVEMQQQPLWSFPSRALYYWAGVHGGKLGEGDFPETLLPTYTLCFLNGRLFDDEAYHHTFHLFDPKHGTLFSRDIEFHTIELNKFSRAADELTTALERWSYFLIHGADLDAGSLPASLDVPVIHRALEVLMNLSQDEIERERYFSRRMAQLDENSRNYQAGAEKGELVGRIHFAEQLLKLPLTPRQELHPMPVKILEELLAQLMLKLTPPTNGTP